MRLLILIATAFCSPALGWGATCEITVENVRGGLPSTKSHTFNKGESNRHHFPLEDSPYICTLAYFAGKKIGTMLGCAKGSIYGDTFYQSDRSMIKESNPRNNLNFRHEESFFRDKHVL